MYSPVNLSRLKTFKIPKIPELRVAPAPLRPYLVNILCHICSSLGVHGWDLVAACPTPPPKMSGISHFIKIKCGVLNLAWIPPLLWLSQKNIKICKEPSNIKILNLNVRLKQTRLISLSRNPQDLFLNEEIIVFMRVSCT